MKIFLAPIIVAILTSCSACEKDEPIVPNNFDESRVPVEVQTEVKTFLKEGNDRGVYTDINDIRKIILVNGGLTNNGKVSAGLYAHDSKTLYIDTSSSLYKNKKEAMIFHELGHALLDRRHKDGGWFQGLTPYSLMNGTGNLPNYTGQFSDHRKYYIDELFNENTPAPEWITSII